MKNKKDLTKLHEELKSVMEKGTEEEARQFLKDHFEEFPKDMQDEIVFASFTEGLDKMVGGEEQALADFQAKGLDAAQQLEKIIRELEDKLKMMDVQQSIEDKGDDK